MSKSKKCVTMVEVPKNPTQYEKMLVFYQKNFVAKGVKVNHSHLGYCMGIYRGTVSNYLDGEMKRPLPRVVDAIMEYLKGFETFQLVKVPTKKEKVKDEAEAEEKVAEAIAEEKAEEIAKENKVSVAYIIFGLFILLLVVMIAFISLQSL